MAQVVAAAAAAARSVTTAGPGSVSYRHGLATTVASSKATAAAPPLPAGPPRPGAAPPTHSDLPPVTRNLMYHRGNNGVSVITGAPKVYLVFWGSQWGSPTIDAHGYVNLSGDPLGMAPDLQAFMKGLGTGGETWSGILTQYCEELIAGSQSCPANAAAHAGYPYGGALAGVWADTATSAPPSATAHQLATEAIAAANHFANTTQTANGDAQYMVVSATGATPDGFNTPNGNFCAWHDWTGDTTLPGGGAAVSPFAVAFTNLPYIPDARGCGGNYVNSGDAGLLDGVTVVAGHEYAETVTDQFPSGGWLDTWSGEIADKCGWLGAAPNWVHPQNITLTTGTFPVPSIWSNDAGTVSGECAVSHPIVPNVKVAPAITSENGYIFTAGAPGTFRVTATGFPVPTLTETGPFPQGITFVDHGDGSALFQGTAVPGQGGIYPVTLTAADGRGGHVSQAFTLTVNEHRAGTIVNFAGAGGGPRGNTGDGGPATGATLLSPYAAAVDRAGTVYIADTNNSRIRTVDAAGTIANFAGDPFNGYGNSGDGGPAALAALGAPEGLAVDGAGNVYIADTLNNRIRKVDKAGIITNLAGSPAGDYGNTGDGGPATSALLGYPMAIAVDSTGNVYFAQGLRVRKVSPAGIITNFAGDRYGTPGHSGDGGPAVNALLSAVRGLAVDGAGNVYISDSSWVRKVDPAGIITNFAGGGGGPGIGDGGSPGIGDGGPATSASLLSPWGLAVDHAGNVFIGDLGHLRVRMVDTSGIISTVAGNPAGTYGYTGDGGPATAAAFEDTMGLAVDGADNLFVVDYNRVREVLGAPPVISSAAATTFTVGLAGSFTVAASAFPAAHLTETGALPTGLSFDPVTGVLRGTPAQGSAGRYAIGFDAANGTAPTASEAFTLNVNQATLTYPTDGQANASTTRPFTWSTIPQAQGYILTVGRHPYGTDLVNTGVLPATQSSYAVPALPAGPTLFATLYAGINGVWTSYQSSSFTVATGLATFAFPLNGQAGVDPTRAFTWMPVAGAQGYLLVVGTTQFGTNLANSGVLAPTQSSYPTPVLPAGQTLYATLLTEVNGGFTRYQAITFTTGPAMGTLTHPTNSQIQVATPTDITWSTIAGAQNYSLVIGSTMYGSDVVTSGLLAPSRSSWHVAALPRGKVLYATLFTRLTGTWVFQEVIFTTSS